MIYTTDFLGLPQELIDILKDRVITQRISRAPQIYDTWIRTGTVPALRKETRVRQSSRTSSLNGYALNWMHSQVHENDFVYLGEQSGVHAFRKESVAFSLYGKEHYVPSQNIFVDQNGKIDIASESTGYSYVTNRKRVEFSAEEVAAMAGVSVDTLYDWDIDTLVTAERNTSTHICNAFVKVSDFETGLIAELFVNGNPTAPNQYGQLTTMQGTRTSLRVNIVTYNDCDASNADGSAGYEAGNFGTCSIAKNVDPTEPFTPSVDISREHAVVEYRFCEQPETGKEWRHHGYFNVKTGQQIPSLIRKPHPDAIYY